MILKVFQVRSRHEDNRFFVKISLNLGHFYSFCCSDAHCSRFISFSSLVRSKLKWFFRKQVIVWLEWFIFYLRQNVLLLPALFVIKCVTYCFCTIVVVDSQIFNSIWWDGCQLSKIIQVIKLNLFFFAPCVVWKMRKQTRVLRK